MIRHLILIAMAAAMAAGSLGCGADIESLSAKPMKHDGEDVSIEGRVGSIRQVGGRGGRTPSYLYEVRDGRHSVWVLRGPDAESQARPRETYDIDVKGVARADYKVEGGEALPMVVIEKSSEQDIPPLAPGSARY